MYSSDLALMSNLFSKRNVEGLVKEFKRKYPNMHFFSRDVEDYPGMIEEMIDLNLKGWVLNSGDGGTHLFLSALYNRYEPSDERIPPLFVLPAGTINVHASMVGHRGVLFSNPQDIMERIIGLKYMENGELDSVRKPLLCVDDGVETRVGCTVANGAVSKYFEEYINDPGFWNAVGQVGKRSSVFVLRELFRQRYEEYFPLRDMSFSLDERVVSDDFHGFAAYAMPFGIVGFHLPHTGEGVQVLATDFGGRRKFIRHFVEGVTGKGFTFEVNGSAENVVIGNAGKYVFDGELWVPRDGANLEISVVEPLYGVL
jgi:hypothetical protein